MFNESEVFFSCPYCFQRISMVFEFLYSYQEYIEDCEVCCQAIEVSYEVEQEKIKIRNVKKAY